MCDFMDSPIKYKMAKLTAIINFNIDLSYELSCVKNASENY